MWEHRREGEAGFDAGPLVVRSDRNVWRAIQDLSAEHDARGMVVGACGQGRLTDLLWAAFPAELSTTPTGPVVVVRTKRSS